MYLELFQRAREFGDRNALVSAGTTYSYAALLDTAQKIAAHLLNGRNDLQEARIAFLVAPSFQYTATQWGIWMAGGVAVPLCDLHPLPSIDYVLKDTGAALLMAGQGFEEFLSPLEKSCGIPVLSLDKFTDGTPCVLPVLNPDRRAMILYTSGTTSQPKGVVTTHRIIQCQITTLVKAWEWEKQDYILNVLPLHHVHGIINVMSCALWSGACCEFLPKFEAAKVWEVIQSGRLTLFMAVPTVYYKLIAHWEVQDESHKNLLSKAVSQLRLMVSGSAALPVSILKKWEEISGQMLLERYGMTEIGMGLSNPYKGKRRAGHVGLPLPGVELRLVDEDEQEVAKGQQGEIQIKGPCVFSEYWEKEAATKAAFTVDGWFRTGDIAVWGKDAYRILGRSSIDIIKSGGYKVSALEVEEVLRKHPDVADCAVIGLPDEEWGEVVAAVVVSRGPEKAGQLLGYLKNILPGYKIPRVVHFLKALPLNVMGKVSKTALKANFGA